jgi:hypothetical protein
MNTLKIEIRKVRAMAAALEFSLLVSGRSADVRCERDADEEDKPRHQP